MVIYFPYLRVFRRPLNVNGSPMLASFEQFVNLVRQLRGPEGCPWDQACTLESLQKEFLEEAEELRDAVKKEDFANIKEELADVLFNLILMGVIAEEKGHFSLKEVLQDGYAKIVSRHTWVFGEDKVKTAEEAIAQWKKNKKKEKKPVPTRTKTLAAKNKFAINAAAKGKTPAKTVINNKKNTTAKPKPTSGQAKKLIKK